MSTRDAKDSEKEVLKKAMKAICEMPRTKTVQELETQAVDALRKAAAGVLKERQ